jgi:hypothetical protein
VKKKCFGSENIKKSEKKKERERRRKSANEIKKVATNHKSEKREREKKCVQLSNDRVSCLQRSRSKE